jgi:hypothetical protein
MDVRNMIKRVQGFQYPYQQVYATFYSIRKTKTFFAIDTKSSVLNYKQTWPLKVRAMTAFKHIQDYIKIVDERRPITRNR